MSGRFVRPSKYRHIHAESPKAEKLFTDVRKVCSSGDSNYVAVSAKYFAIAQVGGGGPMVVHPNDQPIRFPSKFSKINVHKSKVLDMDFNPFFPDLIASASDDTRVKVTRFPEGGSIAAKETITDALVTLEGHQKKAMFCQFNKVASNVLASAGFDHTVKIWDIEAQAETCEFKDFTDLIQCMEWNRNGSQIATSSKDKVIRVFDPRSEAPASKFDCFTGSKAARVAWMEKMGLLAVCGFSRTSQRKIALFDPRNFDKKLGEIVIDQSAGVMMPYYDEDTSCLFVAGKGDGNIRYFEVVKEAPYIHLLSEFRSNTPQKGIGFGPKTACDFMKHEIVFAMRLLRDVVEPIRFVVPRKAESFQSDIFPDTYAGVPALTAQEWAEGKNAEPKMADLREVAKREGSEVQFVAKKSPAELEKELAQALQRIKELEDEVAALKGAAE